MLPEAIKRFLYEPYILADGEYITTRDYLSIEELNGRFKETIQFLKERNKLYLTVKANNYYVVLGSTCDQIDLVQGTIFFDFSVDIPSLPRLKIKVRESGIPLLDRIASAVELEKLFERELLKSERRLMWYAQYLDRICDPMDFSARTLIELFDLIKTKQSSYKQLYLSTTTDTTAGEAQSLRSAMRKLDMKLKFLAEVLATKGSP